MPSLDQNVSISSYNKKKRRLVNEDKHIFMLSDRIVGESLEDGDFALAFGLVLRLRQLGRVVGLGTAKTLHAVNLHWDKIEHDEETFIAQAVRLTGYSELHIQRLICAWEMLTGDYIPKPYRDKIAGQNLQCLFSEYQLVVLPRVENGRYEFVEQDYRIKDQDWLALSEAPDERTVANLVAEVKGKPRNKNLTTFVMEDNGDVFVYRGKESDFFARLPVDDQREFMRKAVAKAVEILKIVRRNEY